MKWGGYNSQAEERMSRFVGRFINKKMVYSLLSLLTLGLILGASVKWSP